MYEILQFDGIKFRVKIFGVFCGLASLVEKTVSKTYQSVVDRNFIFVDT